MRNPVEWQAALAEFARRELGETLGDRIVALARPALRLIVDESGTTRSRLGGDPLLPPGSDWPTIKDIPLSLVAVLDLAELAAAGAGDWLPTSGLLNFFYEVEAMDNWIFDLGYLEGSASWRVVHVPEGAGVPTPAPEGAQVTPAYPVRFAHELTVPEADEDVLELTEEQRHACYDFHEAWQRRSDELCGLPESAPQHRIGGWPGLIQGSVFHESYHHSRQLDWPEEAERAERDRQVLAENWQLLLQLDSADEPDWLWGDAGKLYFTLPAAACAAGEFDRSWLTFHCC